PVAEEEPYVRAMAARLRVTRPLEHHHARPFAEEEPAPAAVEGTHEIPRQGAQHVEAALDEPAEDVHSAREDDVGAPVAEEVGSQPEAGGARRAGRRHREDGPRGSEPPGQVARG